MTGERSRQDLRHQRPRGVRRRDRRRRRLGRLQFLPAVAPLRHAIAGCRAVGSVAWRPAPCRAVRRSDAGRDRGGVGHGAAGRLAALWRGGPAGACAIASACRSGALSALRPRRTCRRSSGGADVLLLEAKPPPKATRPGGNARTLRLVAAARLDRAGPVDSGRRPDRGECRRGDPRHRRPGGGCVVRRRESARVKDPALIRAFIANARAASPSLPLPLREGVGGGGRACSTHPKCRNRQPSGSVRHRSRRGNLSQVHVQAWREAYAGIIPDVGADPASSCPK